MSSGTRLGYLLLADISGYTLYLAGVELDHAHEILSDLLETVLARLTPPLTFAKLEGDAIFAYIDSADMPRGEGLLELIEAAYLAFRNRQQSMRYRTTCTCNACRSIPALDLKFFVHSGHFIVQSVATVKELVGSDVNLVHRLMKNHVSEATGWRAYALFTQAGLASLGLPPDGLHPQAEAYEHLGAVQTYSLNLHERYQEMITTRQVVVRPEAAHHVIRLQYASPLHIIWEWFNDPQKRGRWMLTEIKPITRVKGRAGPGSRNHCVHGKNEIVVEDLLDMRPLEYYTVAHTPEGTKATLLITYWFTPADGGGTQVAIAYRGQIPGLPDLVGRLVAKYAVWRNIEGHWLFDRIDDFANEPAPPAN